MAVFRVEKSNNFTVMSNHHLKNQSLSYKARGILSTILSLPDDWDYTLAGLAKISKDGVASVRAGIQELEEAGYITRTQSRDENGMFTKNIYNVFEIPTVPTKPTDTTDKGTDTKADTKSDTAVETPLCENQTTDNSPLCDFPITDNPSTENPLSGNCTQLNTNILNTNKSSKDKSIYPSYPTDNEVDKIDRIDREHTPQTESMETYEKYKALIKRNISYDDFAEIKHNYDLELIDEIVEVMAETVTFNTKPIKISGYDIPPELVKKKFLDIRYDDIEYILFAFSRNTGKIKNIKSYLVAAVYNAKTTKHSYYDVEVRHDMHNE
jgi:hypothetical protein